MTVDRLPMERHDFTLSEAELQRIDETILNSGAVDGLLLVWELILGHPLSEHDGDVAPWDHSLPEAQSIRIMRAAGTEQFSLLWLNNGPSSRLVA